MAARRLRPSGLPEIDWWYRLVPYRFYDQDGAPVYFGMTRNFDRTKPWWPEVARVKLNLYPTPRALTDAEAWYTVLERPRYCRLDLPEWVDDGTQPPTWEPEMTPLFHAWRQKQLDFFGPSPRQRIVHSLNKRRAA